MNTASPRFAEPHQHYFHARKKRIPSAAPLQPKNARAGLPCPCPPSQTFPVICQTLPIPSPQDGHCKPSTGDFLFFIPQFRLPQHHHSGMAAFDCGLFCNAQTPRSYSIAHIQKKIHRNLAEIPAQIWWICKESMNFSCTREAQGALPLDPAKGSSTLWTPFRAIELVTTAYCFRVFIGETQGALPLDPAKGSLTLWTPFRAIELATLS